MKFPNDITSLTNDLKKEIAEMRSSHCLGTDQTALSSHPVKVEKTYNVALLPPTYLESADYPYGDSIDSPRSSVHSTYEPTKYTRNIRKKPKFRKTKKTISSSLTELDAIIAQWKPILECRSCPETFTCFTLLQDHAWKQHPEVEFYVICCDREFRMRCRLAQHVRLHLNPKTYECKECNRIMASKHNLQEHMDRVHVKTVTPRRNMRHKCHFCPKSYDNPIMLREHVYSHTDQDISQCPYCPRTFRQYNGVYQHIRRVHPGKYLLSQKKNKNRFSV